MKDVDSILMHLVVRPSTKNLWLCKTMLSEQVHTFEEHDVTVIMFQGEPYFRAVDVTRALGYTDSAQALRKNVQNIYVKTRSEMSETGPGATSADLSAGQIAGNPITSPRTKVKSFKQPLYISEPGIYELIWHSKEVEALRFRQWILEEVLPEIRKTGKYVKNAQVSLMCERDLHYKVIDFIRKFFPEAVLVPGLGELQDSEPKRLDAWGKGYKSGQPDILLLTRTRHHNGLAIELKTPLGVGAASTQQETFLRTLQKNRYETLLSNSYDDVIVKILEYRDAARQCIPRSLPRSSGE